MSKRITLCVTGGIAAYKVCYVASALTQAGHQVLVAMTEAATKLVGPATFAGLTRRDVLLDMWEVGDEGMPHIEAAQRTDLILVAPATVDIIGKLAHGIADDLVSTILVAAKAPIILFPSTNVQMYLNPATQENLRILASRNITVVDPNVGPMACRTFGPGRLPEPDEILAFLKPYLNGIQDLAGKRILITSGPTEEPLDAVRVITNRSSGKQGYALAEAASQRGAQVTLVTGPTNLVPPHNVETVNVRTAEEMLQSVSSRFFDCDIFIAAAAVADYRPEREFPGKLKKNGQAKSLRLVENPDILAEMGKRRRENQVLVGFAAETDGLEQSAAAKLAAKGAQLICANPVGVGNCVIGQDVTQITLFCEGGTEERLPLMSKREAADVILDTILRYIHGRECLTAGVKQGEKTQ